MREFDIEKEAEKIVSDMFETDCPEFTVPSLRHTVPDLQRAILAFGRRCADNVLEEAALLMDKAAQQHYGWRPTDESIEGARIRALKSDGGKS